MRKIVSPARFEGIVDYLSREVGLRKNVDFERTWPDLNKLSFTFARDRQPYRDAGIVSLVGVYELAKNCGLKRDRARPFMHKDKGTTVSFKLGPQRTFGAYEQYKKIDPSAIDGELSPKILTISGFEATDYDASQLSNLSMVFNPQAGYHFNLFGPGLIGEFLSEMGFGPTPNDSKLKRLTGRRVLGFFDRLNMVRIVSPVESFPARDYQEGELK